MSLAQKLFESVVYTTIRGKKSSIRNAAESTFNKYCDFVFGSYLHKETSFIDKRGKWGTKWYCIRKEIKF